MTASEAIVLFAHGARDPEWAEPLRRVREAVRARAPSLPVALAFMEFMTPCLDEAIGTLAAAGAQAIVVVPVFLAQGGHLKRDVPAAVEAARRRHPACRIRLAVAAGEDAAVIEALAGYALACAQQPRPAGQ